MELNPEQIEKKLTYYIRLKGRTAIVDNPYATTIPKDTKIEIYNYLPDKELFRVLFPGAKDYGYCYRDEFNLIDKEFSDFKIIKKGIRVERKDKFGDKFMIELLNNKRDIYLSTALISLLQLTDEENYVGFASDPDTGITYVFKSDNISGYLLNKDNNRIISTADWRELFKLHEVMNFEITPQPIVDNNNPGFIFYKVKPNYNHFDNNYIPQPQVQKQKAKSVKKGGGILSQIRETDSTIVGSRGPFSDEIIQSYKQYIVKDNTNWYDGSTTSRVINAKLEDLQIETNKENKKGF